MARISNSADKSSAKKKSAPKPAGAKPAAKAAAKPLKASRASAAKPAAKKPIGKSAGKTNGLNSRQQCIEIAAYFIAERRGFAPGDPMRDWLDAEAEVERLIAQGVISL